MSSSQASVCVLVTGAAGYIGSHTVLALLKRGFDVVAVDDFSNASRTVPDRLARLSGRRAGWVEADVRDGQALRAALSKRAVDAVIHFAGKKSVVESCREPMAYYDVNVAGTLRLLEAMHDAGVNRLVFSSSATVYDASQPSPVTETALLSCASPYGRSKLVAEGMISDLALAWPAFGFVLLRYFNPIGADASGELGERGKGEAGNIMPTVCEVAAGRMAHLEVFGADYDTPDGTGVRDYVHVSDVADAHVAALDHLLVGRPALTLNVGTGTGYSVLQLLRAFESATGVTVPYRLSGRRQGDVGSLYADVAAVQRLLGWRAQRSLEDMCRDAWRWQQNIPRGHGSD